MTIRVVRMLSWYIESLPRNKLAAYLLSNIWTVSRITLPLFPALGAQLSRVSCGVCQKTLS